MSFEDDFKDILISNLNSIGHTINPSDDFHSVGYSYLNVMNRIPEVQKWKVEVSNELQKKKPSLSSNISSGLDDFIQKANAGISLKPHISRLIKRTEYKDMMLYDWNIYHFHLGTTIDPDGFVSRTNELVFAHLKGETIYLIDILPHNGSFFEQDLLAILEGNWPNLLDPYIGNVLGIDPVPSNEDFKKARKAGLQMAVQLPTGRVLFPMGGGYSTAGTSVKIQMEVSRTRQHLSAIEEHVKLDQNGEIKKSLGLSAADYQKCKFKLLEYGAAVKVLEENSGIVLNLPT